MEALTNRAICAPNRFFLLLAVSLFWSSSSSFAASHRTENFIVTARTKPLAVEIANAAERYRSSLAIQWLGRELPRWEQPCPVHADVNPRLGAGGATSFLFETHQHQYGRPVSTRGGDGLYQARPAGRPFGWEMTMQGSRERILDSVLPHEVTHTIFATHFGRPLPRWADEGACTTVEHESEKNKQHQKLYQYLRTDRGIAFNRMFSMNEYPADIMPLYAQGFSVARFLIAQGGRQKFVHYIGDGLNSNNWTDTTNRHYGFKTLSELQLTWLDWVRQGCPPIRAAQEEAKSDDAFPERPQLAKTQPRTSPPPAPSSGSWYAQRSREATQGSTQLALSQWRAVPEKDDERQAARPEESAHQREVLIEWGKPSPILTPTLARRDQQLR